MSWPPIGVNGRVRRLDHAAEQRAGQDDRAQDLGGKLRRLNSSVAHDISVGLKNWVVLAMVASDFADAGEPVIEQVRDVAAGGAPSRAPGAPCQLHRDRADTAC